MEVYMYWISSTVSLAWNESHCFCLCLTNWFPWHWIIKSQPHTCRSAMDRSVPQGAPAAASEQLQPVYETKTMVQQNTEQLKAIEKHLKVHQNNSSQGSCMACNTSNTCYNILFPVAGGPTRPPVPAPIWHVLLCLPSILLHCDCPSTGRCGWLHALPTDTGTKCKKVFLSH